MNEDQAQHQPTLPLANDHNVYILGAGFSAEGGLPVVSEFLNRMRDSHPWLISERREAEALAVQHVLEFRLKATSASYWTKIDLENIEELFSLASIKEDDEKLTRNIKTAIAATLDYAWQAFPRKTCEIVFDGPGHRERIFGPRPAWLNKSGRHANIFETPRYAYLVSRLLGMFAKGKPVGENTFITLNYDTLLEDGLASLGVPFSYGFQQDNVKFADGAIASSAEQPVVVLKLHGSVNWRFGEPTAANVIDLSKLRIFADYKSARDVSIAPELVPPTWNKRFASALADVWTSALDKLRTATRIIIIGFSMPTTDLHFKYLLAAGLKENISLRQILFVNPNAESLKGRVLDNFREEHVQSDKIQFEQAPLGTFLGRIVAGNPIGRPVDLEAKFHVI